MPSSRCLDAACPSRDEGSRSLRTLYKAAELRRQYDMPASTADCLVVICLLTCTTPLLQALEGMHAKGVLHRDVSQGNIIKINSQIKLNDFDISTVFNTTEEQLRARCGTPGFISPYWHQGLPFCKEYDCHALGLAMAAMLRLPEAGAGKLRRLWQCKMVPDAFKKYCMPLKLQH